MREFDYSRFEQVLDFPCELAFKVIVHSASPGALSGVMECLEGLKKGSARGTRGIPRPSSGGRYFAYTIAVHVSSSEHLAQIYAAVSALPYVRHII